MEPTLINPATGRLSVQTVERLHRLLAGDQSVEEMILRFMREKYRARNFFYLSETVGRQILKRPADFVRAAKQHCEPELSF